MRLGPFAAESHQMSASFARNQVLQCCLLTWMTTSRYFSLGVIMISCFFVLMRKNPSSSCRKGEVGTWSAPRHSRSHEVWLLTLSSRPLISSCTTVIVLLTSLTTRLSISALSVAPGPLGSNIWPPLRITRPSCLDKTRQPSTPWWAVSRLNVASTSAGGDGLLDERGATGGMGLLRSMVCGVDESGVGFVSSDDSAIRACVSVYIGRTISHFRRWYVSAGHSSLPL